MGLSVSDHAKLIVDDYEILVSFLCKSDMLSPYIL